MAGAFSRLASWARSLRPAWQAAFAFLAYLLASFVIFALPLFSGLTTRYIGMGRSDAKLYEWSLAWTPYALTHGMNPLTTDRVFAPDGVGLAWTTFMPGPSLVMWPVTALFGTLVSYNALMILAPALAGWAAYLVCRRVTKSFWPSLAGGYLFGFSTYMAGHMHGHANLVLIFPVPLMVYLVIRRVEGSLGRVAFTTWFAVALLGLFSISTELAATAALFGSLAYLIALMAGRGVRLRLLETGGLIVAAGLVSALVLSPYLAMALRDAPTESVRPLDEASVDLYSFFLPRDTTLILGDELDPFTQRFTATTVEDSGYVGIPLVLMLILFVVTRMKRPETPALFGFIVLGSILAMGPVLHVAGVEHGRLPGSLVAKLPLFEHAPSQRFPAYTALAMGVVAALFLVNGRWPAARWGLVLIGAIALLPQVPETESHPLRNLPSFFEERTYEQVIDQGENVLAITDIQGGEMLWQAASGFWFRMPQGYVGPIPPKYRGVQLSRGLAYDQRNPYMPAVETFATWLRDRDVTAVMVHDSARWQFGPLLERVGAAPVYEGGQVSVWRPGPAGYVAFDEAQVTHSGDLDVPGNVVQAFSLPDIETGERITAKSLDGRPVVFVFVGPDCEACAEHLSVMQAYAKDRPDAAVLAVASFYGEGEDPFEILGDAAMTRAADPTGRLATAFGANQLPFTVVLYADHSIRQVWTDPFSGDTPEGFGPPL